MSLPNRVWGPYCRLPTEFSSLQVMAWIRSSKFAAALPSNVRPQSGLGWSFQGPFETDVTSILHTWCSLWSPGGRFTKHPVTYRARKVILETMIRLSWKAALLICLRWKKEQNSCQFSKHETCSYWRYKEIFGTRKVSGLSSNGPLGRVVPRKVSAKLG